MKEPEITEEFNVTYTFCNKYGENVFMTRVRRENSRYFAERWGVTPIIEIEPIENSEGYSNFEEADNVARQEIKNRLERELV